VVVDKVEDGVEVEVGVENWMESVEEVDGVSVEVDDEDDLLVLVFVGGIRDETGPAPVSPSAPCPAPQLLQLMRDLDKSMSCLTVSYSALQSFNPLSVVCERGLGIVELHLGVGENGG